MKIRTKVLATVMCVLISGLSLASCANTANPTSGPSTSSSAAPKEKVKISYSGWGTVEENKATQANIDRFNASQDRIQVEYLLFPWEGYVTQLNTMAAAKNLPDTATLLEQMVMPWVKQDMLADVSSMYSKDDMPLDCITYKSNGKPVAYSTAAECLILYYNQTMFQKAGIAAPPTATSKAWTWDEFVANAKKLTLDKNGKHPDETGFDPQNIVQYGCLVENLAWQLEWVCLSNGGGFYSADGSKVMIGDPKSIEAIQKVADLYLKDHVAPLSVGAEDNGVQRGLIAGTVAMTTNGAWNVGTCLNTAKAEGLKYSVGVLPKMSVSATLATGGTNVVFKQTKHLAESVEWIKWNAQIENAWPLIIQGILPPIFKKYYTDETLTHKWLDNPNFPPYNDYKGAVVDVLNDTKVTHSTAWFYVDNTTAFNALLTSVLGDVWTGKTTAKAAITANLDKFEAAFQGKSK